MLLVNLLVVLSFDLLAYLIQSPGHSYLIFPGTPTAMMTDSLAFIFVCPSSEVSCDDVPFATLMDVLTCRKVSHP